MVNALLRGGVDRLPAPLPRLARDAYQFVRYPQVRRRGRTRRAVLGRLEHPGEVAQGPFAGMRLAGRAHGSEALPKLVGTYEIELHPAVEALCRFGADVIVDIGAAEGYYAAGMALRNAGAAVIAFEIDPSARHDLRRMAESNGVAGRVEVLGGCTVEALRAALEGSRRPAVICDCEGAEADLLDPVAVPALRRAPVLVETHDGLHTPGGVLSGIVERISRRFAPTHRVEAISSRDRTPDDLPPGCPLSPDEAVEAMHEGRPWAHWLFLTPRI